MSLLSPIESPRSPRPSNLKRDHVPSNALRTGDKLFRDYLGRTILLRGVNLSGSTKLPFEPYQPSHIKQGFFDYKNVSFVGRPFPLIEADEHLARLRRWGCNFLRFNITWEALEHAGPGVYDDDYIDYVVQVLQKCKDYGFRVFIDPHQDVWSRWTGGSGAPYWTMTMIGLNPKNFHLTGSAFVQNTHPKPEEFPKMIWPTNYTKLAASTMFTLFFGGNTFAPDCMVPNDLGSGEPINIQDYLQSHYISAVARLAMAITKAGLNDEVVMGYDTLNEPSKGWIGVADITRHDKHVPLLAGNMPTAFQGMMLAEGIPCKVETFGLGVFGPGKTGTTTIDPQGVSAWFMTPEEAKGEFVPPEFIGRGCIWRQHGVWAIENGVPKILQPDYFGHVENVPVDFLKDYWKPFVARFTASLRSIHRWAIMFIEPPVNEAPPRWDDEADDEERAARSDWVVRRASIVADDFLSKDSKLNGRVNGHSRSASHHRADEIQFESRNDRRMVYAPHWYDGLTLMHKSFNSRFNVNVLGVLRNHYYASVQAVALGQYQVREVFAKQLDMITMDGRNNLGNHPTVMGEIGIPFDMKNGASYLAGGDYSQQNLAMDFNMTALERNLLNYTIWNYVSDNCHQWGDGWNGEDLSIFCRDEQILGFRKLQDENFEIVNSRNKYITHKTVDEEDWMQVTKRLTRSQVKSQPKNQVLEKYQRPVILVDGMDPIDPFQDLDMGGRALEAFCRPYPMATAGRLENISFNMQTKEFTMTFKHKFPATLSTDDPTASVMSRGELAQAMTTEIFVPHRHFPHKSDVQVEVDEGQWKWEDRECAGIGTIRILVWRCGCWDQEPKGEKKIVRHTLRLGQYKDVQPGVIGRITRWIW